MRTIPAPAVPRPAKPAVTKVKINIPYKQPKPPKAIVKKAGF